LNALKSKQEQFMSVISLSLSWAWLKRDFRAGELKLLLIALVVATTSLAAVNFFADRMRLALAQQARSLLGGDLVVASDNPIPAEVSDRAKRLNLQVAQTVSFPSMAQVGETFQLSSVKAVSPNYPLRGSLKLGSVGTEAIPKAIGKGEAWIDQSLLSATYLPVKLGDTAFRPKAVIELEPDRGANFASFSPRVMIALEDLADTNLIQPGSRVTYRLLLAGAANDVAAFEQPYKSGEAKLGRGQS
jgi:putative ABC transport system permease protein